MHDSPYLVLALLYIMSLQNLFDDFVYIHIIFALKFVFKRDKMSF